MIPATPPTPYTVTVSNDIKTVVPIVLDPNTIKEQAEKDVAALKEIERQKAETADLLAQAEAARLRMFALIKKLPERGSVPEDVYLAASKVAWAEAENFRHLEARAYGLTDMQGRSDNLDALRRQLSTLQTRLDAGGLNPDEVKALNTRILIVEEAVFAKTHPWPNNHRDHFVRSKMNEWQEKADVLRHVLTQDGWTPENRRPVEEQIRALEYKVKQGEDYFQRSYSTPMSIATPLF